MRTTLSNHEVAQGYRRTDDPSVYVRFPILDGALASTGASLLVWTTTPWTLISNTAVVIGPGTDYVLARATQGGPLLILADALVDAVLGNEAERVRPAAGVVRRAAGRCASVGPGASYPYQVLVMKGGGGDRTAPTDSGRLPAPACAGSGDSDRSEQWEMMMRSAGTSIVAVMIVLGMAIPAYAATPRRADEVPFAILVEDVEGEQCGFPIRWEITGTARDFVFTDDPALDPRDSRRAHHPVDEADPIAGHSRVA